MIMTEIKLNSTSTQAYFRLRITIVVFQVRIYKITFIERNNIISHILKNEFRNS